MTTRKSEHVMRGAMTAIVTPFQQDGTERPRNGSHQHEKCAHRGSLQYHQVGADQNAEAEQSEQQADYLVGGDRLAEYECCDQRRPQRHRERDDRGPTGRHQ